MREGTGICTGRNLGNFNDESINKNMRLFQVAPRTFSGSLRRSHTVPLSAFRSFLKAKVPLPRERNAKISRITKTSEASHQQRGV